MNTSDAGKHKLRRFCHMWGSYGSATTCRHVSSAQGRGQRERTGKTAHTHGAGRESTHQRGHRHRARLMLAIHIALPSLRPGGDGPLRRRDVPGTGITLRREGGAEEPLLSRPVAVQVPPALVLEARPALVLPPRAVGAVVGGERMALHRKGGGLHPTAQGGSAVTSPYRAGRCWGKHMHRGIWTGFVNISRLYTLAHVQPKGCTRACRTIWKHSSSTTELQMPTKLCTTSTPGVQVVARNLSPE
jgi:hypothetical protein